jgi:hypothetical protein
MVEYTEHDVSLQNLIKRWWSRAAPLEGRPGVERDALIQARCYRDSAREAGKGMYANACDCASS